MTQNPSNTNDQKQENPKRIILPPNISKINKVEPLTPEELNKINKEVYSTSTDQDSSNKASTQSQSDNSISFGVNYERNYDFRRGVTFDLTTDAGLNTYSNIMAYATKYLKNSKHGVSFTFDRVPGDYTQVHAHYVYSPKEGLELVFGAGASKNHATGEITPRTFNVVEGELGHGIKVYGQFETGLKKDREGNLNTYWQADFAKSLGLKKLPFDVSPTVSFRGLDGQKAGVYGVTIEEKNGKIGFYILANQNKQLIAGVTITGSFK